MNIREMLSGTKMHNITKIFLLKEYNKLKKTLSLISEKLVSQKEILR